MSTTSNNQFLNPSQVLKYYLGKEHGLTPDQIKQADVNKDGVVNLSDVLQISKEQEPLSSQQLLKLYLKKDVPGISDWQRANTDINRDGVFDLSDVLARQKQTIAEEKAQKQQTVRDKFVEIYNNASLSNQEKAQQINQFAKEEDVDRNFISEAMNIELEPLNTFLDLDPVIVQERYFAGLDPVTRVASQLSAIIDPTSSGGAWTTLGGFRGNKPWWTPEIMLRDIASRLISQTGIQDLRELQQRTVDGELQTYNTRTGQPVNVNLGGWSQGEGFTWANFSFDANGRPKISTYGEDSSDLGSLLPIISIALMAVPGIGQAVGAAILPAGVSTAITTAVGNAVINAGIQVASGVPVERALTNAAVSVGVSQLVPNLTNNLYVDNAVRSVATAALTGGDVGTALANSLIATGGAELLGNASFTGDTVADSAIASAITGGVQAAATGGDVAQSIVQSAVSGAVSQINREETQATRAASGAGFVGSDEDQAAVADTVAGGAVADTVAGGATEADVLNLVAQDQDLTVDQSTNPLIAGQLAGAPTAGDAALVQTGLDTTTGAAGIDTVAGGQAGDTIFGAYTLTPNQTATEARTKFENGEPVSEVVTVFDVDEEGNQLVFHVIKDLRTGDIFYETMQQTSDPSDPNQQIVIRASKFPPTTDYVTDESGNIVRDSSGNPVLTSAGAEASSEAEESSAQPAASASGATDANLSVTTPADLLTSGNAGLGDTTSAVVLQNNNDGTALVLTQDGNATNVNATDSNTGNQLTAGDTVTVNNQDNTATTTTVITGGSGDLGSGNQNITAVLPAQNVSTGGAASARNEQNILDLINQGEGMGSGGDLSGGGVPSVITGGGGDFASGGGVTSGVTGGDIGGVTGGDSIAGGDGVGTGGDLAIGGGGNLSLDTLPSGLLEDTLPGSLLQDTTPGGLASETIPGGNLTDLTGGGVDLGGGVTGGVTGGGGDLGGGGGGGGGDLGDEITDDDLIDLITSDLDTSKTPVQDATQISVVPRRVARPRPPPGSRVTEVDAAGLLPLRPGLSEGGTGGIEGTTEEEQKPVWNVRSLKLRRALGI